MITSAQNAKIKWVRALQTQAKDRHESKAFIVEGVRLVEEALAAHWEPQLVLYTAGLSERGQALVRAYADRSATLEEVTPAVLHSASDTQSPQGILVVLKQRCLPLPPRADFVFIPDGVRDPGNLGTMLRTAAAAGVQGVLLPPGAVDPFAPKVVRAAMGAHFRLPIQVMEWKAIAAVVMECGLQTYLASAGDGQPHTLSDFRRPLALIIGGEAAGAGPEAARLAQVHVHIPMPGQIESLNAAAAAAILLFEVARQRE
jgi:RNA methyltransferase, TrmH family